MKVTTDDFQNFINEITAEDFERSVCCSFVRLDKSCEIATASIDITGFRYASGQDAENKLFMVSQPLNTTIKVMYDSIEMDEVTPDFHEPNEEVWQYSFHKEGVEEYASLIFEFS